MKNIINKIILFAAVLFAAGFSQNAAAFGFFLNPATNNFYIVADYNTAGDAETAARQYCRNNFNQGNVSFCNTTSTGRMLSFGNNEVVAFNTAGFEGSGFEGAGATRQAAYEALLRNCEMTTSQNAGECRTSSPMSSTMFCGDGTAADLTDATFPNADECSMRNPPTCGTGTTGTLNAQNECECMDNTHNLITDTATNTQTCEAPPPPPPESGASFGYYIADDSGSGLSTVYSASGYSTAELAEQGAVKDCMDNGESLNDCETNFNVNRGVLGGTETNRVVVWSNSTENYIGVGFDINDAYAKFFAACSLVRNMNVCSTENDYVQANILSCGAGSQEDLSDDCGERPSPLTCTGDATMNTAGTECECNVAASPFLQDDGGNSFSCRAPNSTDECTSIDRNTGFYDTGSASCRMPTGTPGENSFDCTEIADAVDRANGVQNMTVDRRYIFDTSAPGLCRTPKSALECGFAGLGLYYDSAADFCRAPMTDAECMENLGNRTPFINDAGTNCRTANSPEECEEAYPVDGLNLPIHDTTAFGNCRIAQSAADCPGEFFNAVSPARCEPIRTCGTGTTGTVTQNQCECAEEGDLFVLGSNMQMCETPVPATCGANAINSPDDIRLCVCENTETHQFVAGSTTACEPIPATCGANAINDPDDNTMCVCENTETHQFVAGSTTDCEPIPTNPNTPTCEEHQMLNSSNECVNRTAENCGNAQVFSPVNSGGICQTPAAFFAANTITVAAEYSAESCESAGWISSIAINNEKTAAAELCGIPVVRDDSVTATAAAANAETAAAETAAAESVPLQFPENENANGCIIRESADFLTLPDCNDSQLFGNIGFPQMPENFAVATDRLTVAFVADGENQIFFNGEEIKNSDSGTQSPPPTTNTPTTGGGGNLIVASDGIDYTQFGGVVGGVVAVYIGINYISGNFAADDFSFSPDFGYRITESGYSANAGGRMDLRKDELHLYSIAKQTNANGEFGDFRYTTGGKYTADFWTATFSESLQGETVNYDFSLSANLQSGIWNISPIYRMHSRFDKDETETRNSLNLQSEFRYNRWTINPSAGFRWENENNFSENARFQINAVHRF